MQGGGFLVDKETKDYRGVETVSGQHLYSGKLITGPSFCVGSVQPRLTEDRGTEEGTAQFSSSEYASSNTESLSNRRNITPYKVACCICITDQSLQPGLSVLQQHWWCEPCSWGQGLKFVPMANSSCNCLLFAQIQQLEMRPCKQLLVLCFNVKTGSDVTDSNRKPKLLWSLFDVQATSNPWVFHKLFPEQDFLPRAVVAANNVED